MAAITGRAGGLLSRVTGDQEVGARMTGEGNYLHEQLSGRWAERNYRGNVASFSVVAVTIPVNANNLVSVCGIYNPPGSNKILEIIDTDLENVLATTVVNAYAWYSSTVALSALATFTTPGTARSRRMQDPASSQTRVYTAVTHSGTPSLEAMIGGHGATTNAGFQTYKKFDGTLMIPPGVLASVAATTAASTGSGMAIGFSWAELPI